MTDFVLVHGAFHGAWVWEAVVERLTETSHRVMAPDLPGSGKSETDVHKISLTDQIDCVVALIEDQDLRDIVLVGHSMGGMVVTGVADRVRDRIGHLIYLDALVPESGQSVRDLVPPEMYRQAIAAIQARRGRPALPPIFPVEKFVDYRGDEAAAFMDKLTPQPLLVIVEPLFLINPPVEKRTFIYCSGVPFGAFDNFARAAQESREWRYVELPTAHDAMLIAPDRICAILLGAIDA